MDQMSIELPAGQLHVRCWGTPTTRAPILLLHDSLGSAALWRDFPDALVQATGRQVYAYDRFGFGESSARHQRPSIRFIEEEATQVFPALMDALSLQRCVSFGHSVGGAMALTIAAKHPGRCEAVVSLSAQASVEQRTLDGIRAAQARFAQPGQLDRLARWHGDKAAWVLDAWAGVWLSPGFRDWSLIPTLAEIHCPALVIHGDGDEYGSVEFPRSIAANVPGPVRLEILEGCGHLPHRERREEVLEIVAAFLA
ncbi:MAG: alpha/beta fold hydrolase [Proteobacteria bacterium]|nr:alpha/beta fold hydrolase [Pseudomonadota bacterium]